MSERPASTKRKRTEQEPSETAPAPDPIPVRSKIWMPYGDIILQAESTQFRVNRDNLARQSSVFRDMFAVPQPPNEPTVEGCPIVHVSDTAKDWELLLEVIYHPFHTSASRPFPVVASMLRLGKKYDIAEAREDALSRIHFEFPSDLESWRTTPNGLTKINSSASVHVDLLNLVFECGVHTSIPTLGLFCLTFQTLEAMLLTGVQREDGSSATIPAHTFATLAIALERLLNFQRAFTLSWLNDDGVVPYKLCKSRKICERQKKEISHLVFWRDPNGHDVSYTVHEWDVAWADKLCDVCEVAAKTFYEVSCKKGWELLPTFFGLGEWKDLKDAD